MMDFMWVRIFYCLNQFLWILSATTSCKKLVMLWGPTANYKNSCPSDSRSAYMAVSLCYLCSKSTKNLVWCLHYKKQMVSALSIPYSTWSMYKASNDLSISCKVLRRSAFLKDPNSTQKIFHCTLEVLNYYQQTFGCSKLCDGLFSSEKGVYFWVIFS